MLVAVVLVIVGLIPISRHSYDSTQPTCMFQKARPDITALDLSGYDLSTLRALRAVLAQRD